MKLKSVRFLDVNKGTKSALLSIFYKLPSKSGYHGQSVSGIEL